MSGESITRLSGTRLSGTRHSGAGEASPQAGTLSGPTGVPSLAYHRLTGAGPGLVWLGGFKSDMTGTKATALENWAAARGRAYLRFDYSGHGTSEGRFEDGTIGAWRNDALRILDHLCEGPQVLIGSSMGGWLALLCALARPDKVAGLFLIAPAPDFTEDLMWAEMDEATRAALQRGEPFERPTDYDTAPQVITYRLIEEGRGHLLLGGPIAIDRPVRIVHGMADRDVPWQRSLTLVERLAGGDVTVEFLKSGDHRLSDPASLGHLEAALGAFLDHLARAG